MKADLPRIGITTSYVDGRQILDTHYVRAVESAGGLPLIAPLLETEAAARAFADLLDGLIITGGPGITRGLVGALPDDLEPVDPARDHSDALIYEAMADRNILGICYGMQFINAMHGGTLYADVQRQRPDTMTHSAGRGGTDHPVRLAPDSHLAAALHTHELITNTYHIQAVVDVGAGLRAVGFGPDGVIEAIESADGRHIGVQFHPERMLDQTSPLFADFVARCRMAR